jgi:hypothetical protein
MSSDEEASSEEVTLTPRQRVEAAPATDRHKVALALWKGFCDDTDLEMVDDYLAMLSMANELGAPILSWSEKDACIIKRAPLGAKTFEQFLWEKRRKYALQMLAIQSSSAAERRAFDWETFDAIDSDLLRSEDFLADDPEWAGLVTAFKDGEREYEAQEAARQLAAEKQ